MMRIKEHKTEWYIIAIIVIMVALSLISWAYFAKRMGSILKAKLTYSEETIIDSSNRNSDAVMEDERSEKGIINYIEKGSNYLDKVIYKVYDLWSIYKQPFFAKIDSIATYYLTEEISSSQVIGGKEGWLFYGSKTDADSIGDYEGTNSYTQSELNAACSAALSVQQSLKNEGIQFAILVPPNKENIYSEYMPDSYSHQLQSRTDCLVEYLFNNGVNIISPKNNMLSFHDDYQLYYSYDTHWNQLGAYIGVKETLQTWGYDMKEISERAVSSSELMDEYHYCGEDDLAQMIGMRFLFSDEKEYTIDGTQTMDWLKFQSEQENSEISYFHNEKAIIKSTILLIGDSFRSATVPSLREQFSDVYVVNRSYFSSQMIDEIMPDYIMVVCVERYSYIIGDLETLFK